MNRRPKAESMVTFGWVMLGAYILAGLGCWLLEKDPQDARAHTLMFFTGSILWIAMIFIWMRNAKHGD